MLFAFHRERRTKEKEKNRKRVKGNVRSRVRESVIFAVYRKKINKIVFVLINCKASQLLLKFNIILKHLVLSAYATRAHINIFSRRPRLLRNLAEVL